MLNSPTLNGKVALVTGATRGLGKGIAVGLGEAGATVYITGRSRHASDNNLGNLTETQAAVEAAGGQCIPIQVDHSDDGQIQALFDRIQTEQNGQLDLLVNNVYGGVQALGQAQEQPFWQLAPDFWDACNQVGLRSHYLASVFAARLMSARQQGLICTISSWGGLAPLFGVAYGTGKAACDRLAADMALELKPQGISSIALWPGIVGTELITQMVDAGKAEALGVNPRLRLIQDRFNWETPLLTGRVIAAIAQDPQVLQRTGRVHIVAEWAKRYGVVDREGNLPVSLRSLKFLLPTAMPSLRHQQAWIPDVYMPWLLLLWTSLASPRV